MLIKTFVYLKKPFLVAHTLTLARKVWLKPMSKVIVLHSWARLWRSCKAVYLYKLCWAFICKLSVILLVSLVISDSHLFLKVERRLWQLKGKPHKTWNPSEDLRNGTGKSCKKGSTAWSWSERKGIELSHYLFICLRYLNWQAQFSYKAGWNCGRYRGQTTTLGATFSLFCNKCVGSWMFHANQYCEDAGDMAYHLLSSSEKNRKSNLLQMS